MKSFIRKLWGMDFNKVKLIVFGFKYLYWIMGWFWFLKEMDGLFVIYFKFWEDFDILIKLVL